MAARLEMTLLWYRPLLLSQKCPSGHKTNFIYTKKQKGLYQNKVTSGLASIQRPRHWADNSKMVYLFPSERNSNLIEKSISMMYLWASDRINAVVGKVQSTTSCLSFNTTTWSWRHLAFFPRTSVTLQSENRCACYHRYRKILYSNCRLFTVLLLLYCFYALFF